MPWTSDELPVDLECLVAEIENETIGFLVVRVNQWHFPVNKICVEFVLSSQRKINILEKFVLMAMQLKLSKPMTAEYIADLLGLDVLFINSCVSDLNRRGVLDRASLPTLVLNKLGLQHYEKETLPDAEETREVEFYFNRVLGAAYSSIVVKDTVSKFRHYKKIEELTTEKHYKVNKSLVIEIAKDCGIETEIPKNGKKLTKLVSLKTLGKDQTLMSEIWILDLMEGRYFCRVWDHAKECYQRELSELIETSRLGVIHDGSNVSLSESISDNIKGLIKSARTEGTAGTKNSFKPFIQIYHSMEFQSKFFESILQTEKQLIMSFSDIPLSFFDVKMMDVLRVIAQKNIQILIGFGNGGDYKVDTNPIYKCLSQELLSVCNKSGMPMVCFIPLADKREDEIVIDNTTYITGSFNLLFCNDGQLQREELIFLITDRTFVEKQKVYWEHSCNEL